ncbi:MAG: hypothetical protein H5T68_02035 [Chloroflexi bacterium]|nr:hypothetical protein [Chloroflexota bacterium]
MRIGEIVETTSTGFVAESFTLNRPPPLGSLVAVSLPAQDMEIYAVVAYGQTVGLDPGRRAVRRSTEIVFDEAIYHEHPELKHILRTEFGAVLVGYLAEGQVWQHLPPQPPPLHFSVQTVETGELRRFTDHLLYFRLLLSYNGPVSPLQVLAANVREVYRQRGSDRAWLDVAAREIATLLKNDHEALLTVLYAIDPGEASAIAERRGQL